MAAPQGKKVTGLIKLQIQAGKANPSPPVGPALGQKGVNIMEFCKAFNDRTKEMEGPIPVVISVFEDRSFAFETKLPPASYLLLKAASLQSGSKAPGKDSAGKISMDKVREVAKFKLQDMSANDVEAATKTIAGTARSMGLEVVE